MKEDIREILESFIKHQLAIEEATEKIYDLFFEMFFMKRR